MNKDLLDLFAKSIDLLKNDDRCLGGWNFGSMSRNLEDEYSDVDPVFLIEGAYFEEFASEVPTMLAPICDRVLLVWPQEYNSDHLKNFGFLLEYHHDIFQYDFFIINSNRVSEHFCKVHREGCTEKDILFDRTGVVTNLLSAHLTGTIEERNVPVLIEKYWFHVNMLIKYVLRKDIFKLKKNLEILFHTHCEVLLAAYQQTTWGGWESKAKHNLPEQKQNHLKQYFCRGTLEDMGSTIVKCMKLFSEDAREVCLQKGIAYLADIEAIIESYFFYKTGRRI